MTLKTNLALILSLLINGTSFSFASEKNHWISYPASTQGIKDNCELLSSLKEAAHQIELFQCQYNEHFKTVLDGNDVYLSIASSEDRERFMLYTGSYSPVMSRSAIRIATLIQNKKPMLLTYVANSTGSSGLIDYEISIWDLDFKTNHGVIQFTSDDEDGWIDDKKWTNYLVDLDNDGNMEFLTGSLEDKSFHTTHESWSYSHKSKKYIRSKKL